jgi:hypothetical protein
MRLPSMMAVGLLGTGVACVAVSGLLLLSFSGRPAVLGGGASSRVLMAYRHWLIFGEGDGYGAWVEVENMQPLSEADIRAAADSPFIADSVIMRQVTEKEVAEFAIRLLPSCRKVDPFGMAYRFDFTGPTQESSWTFLLVSLPRLTMLSPLPFVLLLIGSMLAIRGRRRRAGGGLCVKCGYDLKGNVSGVCPECGDRVQSNGLQGG